MDVSTSTARGKFFLLFDYHFLENFGEVNLLHALLKTFTSEIPAPQTFSTMTESRTFGQLKSDQEKIKIFDFLDSNVFG